MGYFISFFIILSAFVSIILFDYLIFVQNRDYPEVWMRDGRPNGIVYIPPDNGKSGAELRQAGFATGRVVRAMWWKMPDWISGSKPSVRIAYWTFRLIFFSNLIILPGYFLVKILF